MTGSLSFYPMFALAVLAFPAAAGAVTLTSLKGMDLAGARGSYGPRGDCAGPVGLTIDESGFTFRALGRTVRPARFEYAASYLGPEYRGITAVFFPFPIDDGDFGRLVMLVNEGEKRGVVRLDADLGPGQRSDAFQAALLAGSPFLRCKGGGATAQGTGSPPAPTFAAGRGTPWEVVPVQGRPPMAHVDVAGSTGVRSVALFCEGSRPTMAVLLNRPNGLARMVMTWSLAGRTVDVPLVSSNGAGTFWQAVMGGSPLLAMLLRERGPATLRINGRAEGEASLAGAPVAMRTALRGCLPG